MCGRMPFVSSHPPAPLVLCFKEGGGSGISLGVRAPGARRAPRSSTRHHLAKKRRCDAWSNELHLAQSLHPFGSLQMSIDAWATGSSPTRILKTRASRSHIAGLLFNALKKREAGRFIMSLCLLGTHSCTPPKTRAESAFNVKKLLRSVRFWSIESGEMLKVFTDSSRRS